MSVNGSIGSDARSMWLEFPTASRTLFRLYIGSTTITCALSRSSVDRFGHPAVRRAGTRPVSAVKDGYRHLHLQTLLRGQVADVPSLHIGSSTGSEVILGQQKLLVCKRPCQEAPSVRVFEWHPRFASCPLLPVSRRLQDAT